MIYMEADDIGTIKRSDLDDNKDLKKIQNILNTGMKVKTLVTLITTIPREDLQNFVEFIGRSTDSGVLEAIQSDTDTEDIAKDWCEATEAILKAYDHLGGKDKL